MQQLKWKPSEFGLGEKPGEIWEAYLDDASYMIIPDKGMYELSHEDDEGNELSEPAYYATIEQCKAHAQGIEDYKNGTYQNEKAYTQAYAAQECDTAATIQGEASLARWPKCRQPQHKKWR